MLMQLSEFTSTLQRQGEEEQESSQKFWVESPKKRLCKPTTPPCSVRTTNLPSHAAKTTLDRVVFNTDRYD
ncbi:hypothetical protein [Endozoicomonas sp. ALC020]|uniref:hypothetical protein n=1 Tax=unclassified Endozoicomonas TaxID=2644528 RepID=UPI003BAF0A7E